VVRPERIEPPRGTVAEVPVGIRVPCQEADRIVVFD
jgi:hypothetical protein